MPGTKGRSGRPRKPSALKILHGDFEIHPSRQNTREPISKRGRPRRPAWVKGIARHEWDRTVKHLDDMRVLTLEHGASLEQYVKAYQQWRIAVADVEDRGIEIEYQTKDDRTAYRANPNVRLMHESSKQCHRWLTEFGLTPASKTRVQLDTETNSKSGLEKKYLG